MKCEYGKTNTEKRIWKSEYGKVNMEKQIYNTKIKKKILECFAENAEASHSAKDIHAELTKNGEKVNITTVYRNLDLMTGDGVLLRFQDNKCEKAMYKYSGDGGRCHSHLHLSCVKCGCMIHLDCHFMNELREHIKKEHGFSLMCSNSVIYGVCKECEGKENAWE